MNNNINLNNADPHEGRLCPHDHMIIVNEFWTNLFLTSIFKTKSEAKLELGEIEEDPDKNAEVETKFDFEQDGNNDLVFKEDIYGEYIKIKASQLFRLLHEKNMKVTADKLLEVYKAFAEFRCSLSYYLDSKVNPNDIYNYHNWCPWISNPEFQEAQKELLKSREDLYAHPEEQCERFVRTRSNESKIDVLNNRKKANDLALSELKNRANDLNNQLQAFEFHWYHVFLWLLLLVPGLIHERKRREQINLISSDKDEVYDEISVADKKGKTLQDEINILDTRIQKDKLSDTDYNNTRDIFVAVQNAETEIENIKLKIFKTSHSELVKNMTDDKIQDIIFNVERQLNTLQQYEVFFNNLLLQLNDQEFLNRLNGKSLDEFFRDESNNFVVNFIGKACQACAPKSVKIAKLDVAQGGATQNTYKINLNGENYYVKGGHLFLNELRERLGVNHQYIDQVDMENRITQNQIAIFSEVYRGNLKLEPNNWNNVLPNEKAKLFEQPSEQKQILIDTSLHGLAENIFANFLGLSNFLVDSKLVMTEQGYSILMREAEGKLTSQLANELLNKQGVNLAISNFLFCNQGYFNPSFQNLPGNPVANNMQVNNCLNTFGENQLRNLQNNNLISKELQNSILWINMLDYICGNFDRHCGNYFVSKGKVTGIDSEGVFPVDNRPNRACFMPLTPQDLPNLIPVATGEQYNKIIWLNTDEGRAKVADAIKIAVKTIDRDTLNKVITAAWERINNMYDHFVSLEKKNMIFHDMSQLNSQTASQLTACSRLVSLSKQNTAKLYGFLNNFTGTGFALWAVTDNNVLPEPKLNPKLRDENNLF